MGKFRSIIEDEELIGHIHPSLLHLDYDNYFIHICLVLATTLSFISIFFISSFLFSYTKVYRGLRGKEQIFWNLAICRACFGLYTTIAGAWAIFTTNNHHRDIVDGQTATGYVTLCISTGFFFFECVALTGSDVMSGRCSYLLHVHHWLCFLGGILTIYARTGYSIPVMGLTVEMTTPFSAVCWILLIAGLGNSLLWKTNQMILLHTFHLRSVVECYVWYLLYREWPLVQATMPWPTFILTVLVLCVFTFVATPYWGYKKTVQLFRPVDWNFEPAEQNHTSNGHAKKVE